MRHLPVLLVVHEIERCPSDTSGELFELDAVELSDRHLAEQGDVHRTLSGRTLLFGDAMEELCLHPAKFSIGNDEEVATAAGRVEEAERGEPVMEALECRQGPCCLELCFEVVEEQGPDSSEDVCFGRVVSTELAPLF